MILLLAALGCQPHCEDPGAICTVAGTGDLGFNGQDLPASETWLFYPSGIALDPEGRLVVDDFNNFLIRVLQEDGILKTLAGKNYHAWAVEGPALDSPMENPVDVDVGADGTLFVAELHTFRILRVREGHLDAYAGTGVQGYEGDGGPAKDALFSAATGVEVADDGTVYVADTGNHVIRAIAPDGVVTTLAGTGTSGLQDGPFAEARFAAPERMHLDGDLLYVADRGAHAIRRLDLLAGTVETVAGTGEEGAFVEGDALASPLREPIGVAVGPDGAIWVADSGNHAVHRVRDGVLEHVAGDGLPTYQGDGGPGRKASLNLPADVAVDAHGDVYVADMLNSVVRKITAPP